MGAYSRVGAYSKQRFEGYLFNNPVSRVGAFSRVGAYSRGALNRSITVIHYHKLLLCYFANYSLHFLFPDHMGGLKVL